MKIGDFCIYSDPKGNRHEALITQVWGTDSAPIKPSVNLVYVSKDESQTDQYGRQIARQTSVVHRTSQPAHGMFYEMPDELTAG